MISFKSVVVFLYLTFTIISAENIKKCPRFCKCDSYIQLNRAQCSSKRLINAEVDIPYQVQILDLSYNDITAIDKNCFEHFSHLKYLNLSNNALHTLDFEAFAKLRRLIELDLSYNRLEYLDERLLSKNKQLRKLNLEGNKFMSLNPKVLLKNPFLLELNLRNSQINLLHSELFAGLPNLILLDLSKNLINNFNLEDFKHMTKLQKLNLDENSLKCDETIKTKLEELKTRGINVTLDLCSAKIVTKLQKSPTQMLEKMILATTTTNQLEDLDSDYFDNINQWRFHSDNENDESMEENDVEKEVDFSYKENNIRIRKNNEWLRFAPNSILCNAHNFVLCQEYRTCLEDLNKAWHEKREYKEQFPLHDIKLTFFLGIALGISAIVIILACALCLKRCMEIKKADETVEDLPSQPLARPTSQLPVNVRRSPRRRGTTPARSVVRYEGPVAENFLSRLFGRPARQQYYRSINHNTATFIRRLSRSNLFNNRLSQHFVDSQTCSDATNSSRTGEQNYTPTAPRTETPPPSYGDVVINNCEHNK